MRCPAPLLTFKTLTKARVSVTKTTSGMPASQKKSGKSTGKQLQAKLSDFASKVNPDASMEEGEANANTPDANEWKDGKTAAVTGTQNGSEMVLAAINNLKSDFSSKLDGILTAIENVRKDINDCVERVSHAETRISTTEDTVNSLQTKVQTLENQTKTLQEQILDLETRSRRSNLRLVNLPEGAEGDDACTFLERWLPEAVGLQPMRSPLTLERAHRIGQRNAPNNASPRTVIMKFLNYRDKISVVRAARAKGRILFKDCSVRLYEDLATGVHKKQKEFDAARRQLRALGIRCGMIPPARLLVTYGDQSRIFTKPSDAENFIKSLRPEKETG